MAEDTSTTDAPPAPTDPPDDKGGSGDTPKTFTQDQVNDLIAKEKGKIQSRYGDYDDLKSKAAKLDEIEESNRSEVEKAQGKLSKAESERDEAKAKLLRFEVAAAKEVPAKLVPLLTATTKEGLEEQADLILENAKSGGDTPPDFNGGPRDPTPEPKTPEAAHNELMLQLMGRAPE